MDVGQLQLRQRVAAAADDDPSAEDHVVNVADLLRPAHPLSDAGDLVRLHAAVGAGELGRTPPGAERLSGAGDRADILVRERGQRRQRQRDAAALLDETQVA